MAGDSVLTQASQIWSMLDDMAETNPTAYRKFIDKHLKEGAEMREAPKTHMCVQTTIVKTGIPLFINVCSWARVPNPKDRESPIPIHGRPLTERNAESEKDAYFLVHVAFNPEVLSMFGKSCAQLDERDALIELAMTFLEDQHKIKLSRSFRVLDIGYKGDSKELPAAFGFGSEPFVKDFELLANSFAPVTNILSRDPQLLTQIADLTSESSSPIRPQQTVDPPQVILPGLNCPTPVRTKLIQEMKRIPPYRITKAGSSLIVTAELDGVCSVEDCMLELTETGLRLETQSYALDIILQEQVQEEAVRARFSKAKQTLTVTLPLMN